MKKIVLILLAVVGLSSCSINDDETPNIEYELAEITANDLPDEFEMGKTYTVTVTYLLPSQCNTFAGIDARRAGNTGPERRQIFIAAVSRFVNSTECDAQTSGNSGTSTFTITVDENEDYTFYFWTGTNAADEPLYDEVTVPVVDIETTGTLKK
ncbi:membrane lipoprotein lipid attachment site-containing protein [Christiangramia aestuarii]|uniref:Lipoprotein n=1 Tax=Christiangramia aestuarii TaxID=1028746 RepID=A0A7K1LRC3_9FLAO|nr:membrane lipoprotein lipid attachment site-containing protein [Christiangramia aestuarii]MUP43308.1 hypothetical protein [Christiangramia aestuarii]